MPRLSHLPRAIAHAESDDFSQLDDVTLLMLIDECERWQKRAERFRSQIKSPSALVVWQALVEADRASVLSVCKRLHEEMERRNLNPISDAEGETPGR